MANQVLEPQLPTGARAAAQGETCRMFESDFLERFSRIHPATPFVVVGPGGRALPRAQRAAARPSAPSRIAGAVPRSACSRGRSPSTCCTGTSFTGPTTRPGQAHPLPAPRRAPRVPERQGPARDAAAHEHARSRSSSTRSSRSRWGAPLGEPFFAGFVVGYLFYDGTHYYVHHFVPTTRWGKFLRRHHMTHHFADHDGGFGVSSPLWDLIFRTMPAKKQRGRSAAANRATADRQATTIARAR